MRAYQVSKESSKSLEEKLELIESYDTEALLYVVREYEEIPRRFEDDVIKAVAKKLYIKGIMCI